MSAERNHMDIYTTRRDCNIRADRMTNPAQQKAYRALTEKLLTAMDMYFYYMRKEPDMRPEHFVEVMSQKKDDIQSIKLLMTLVEYHFEDDTGGILQAMLPSVQAPAQFSGALH